jgi:hypothetical protein
MRYQRSDGVLGRKESVGQQVFTFRRGASRASRHLPTAPRHSRMALLHVSLKMLKL